MQSKVKILLIYTGGTIGMMKHFESGALKAFNFSKLLQKIPELKQLDCEIETISFEKPMDSSNFNPKHWVQIAEIIEENYEKSKSLWHFHPRVRSAIEYFIGEHS